MEFSVYERLMLLQIVPVAHQEGSFVTQRALGDYLNDLGFTDLEIEEIELESFPDGRVQWDEAKAEPKDIEMSEVRMGLTYDSLKALDDRGQISANMMPIFEKFNYEGWLADQESDEE